MTYYLIAAIVPLVIMCLRGYSFNNYRYSNARKIKIERWLVFFAMLPIFLLYVLRGSHMGVDTIGYVRTFQNIDGSLINVWENADKDPGFFVYTRIVSFITRDYTIYFLITGLVVFLPIYFFSLRHTQNPYIFIFLIITLGYYSFIETGMRQAMSMSICLTSYGAIKNKNFKNIIRMALTVFIAYFVHKSAVIFLLLFILSFLKDNTVSRIIYVAIIALFAFNFSFFQDLFNELLGYSYEVEATGNGEIFFALILVLYILNFIFGNRVSDKKENQILFNATNLTLLMWVLRLISRTAERISFYFILGFYAYITGIFAPNKNSDEEKFLQFVVILVCLALFVYRNYGATYNFFWQ